MEEGLKFIQCRCWYRLDHQYHSTFNSKGWLVEHRFHVDVKHHNIFNYLFEVKHVFEILFNLKFMLPNNISS